MIKPKFLTDVYRINNNMGMGRYDCWYIFRSKFAAVMKLGELEVDYPNCCFTIGVQKLY